MGFRVELHGESFAPSTPDEVWLRGVGKRRLTPLTRDTRIRHREFERLAVEVAGVGLIVLTGRTDMDTTTMIETIRKAGRKLATLLKGLRRPFIVHISADSSVRVAWPRPSPPAALV